MLYTFRPHASYRGQYVETNSFDDMRDKVRQYAPSGTTFRCVKLSGDDFYTVLRLSDYVIGPVIAGYLRIH